MSTEIESPKVTDIDWPDFVMSQFAQEELMNGHPTTDALRRVTELVLGPIRFSGCTLIQAPNAENGDRAIVSTRVAIESKDSGDLLIEIEDLADASPLNTPQAFRPHLIPTASTRSEGRCLRKALKLRKVLAAEELNAEPEQTGYGTIAPPGDKVAPQQITLINTLIKRVGVDTDKFLESQGVSTINEASYEQAGQMIQELNKYQQDGRTVPKKLKEKNE